MCIVVCDGLKGLPESITTTCSFAQVQACIPHLIRNTFRYTSRTDWDQLARDLRPVYTAVNAEMAAALGAVGSGPVGFFIRAKCS